MNFFTVTLRRTAYLEVAPVVAAFEVYRPAILNHLFNVSTPHWDRDIRQLASLSLRCMARKEIDLDLTARLPALVRASSDSFVRQLISA